MGINFSGWKSKISELGNSKSKQFLIELVFLDSHMQSGVYPHTAKRERCGLCLFLEGH